NKNKLLTQYYDKCIGGKTGFTKKAGRTLLTTANEKDKNLIAVTLNAPDDWRDHIGMYEWGFENFDMKSIGKQKVAPVNSKEYSDSKESLFTESVSIFKQISGWEEMVNLIWSCMAIIG